MDKKQAILASNYTFVDEMVAEQQQKEQDVFSHMTSKNIITNRRKQLEDLLAKLSQK